MGSRPGTDLSDPGTATRYALRLLGSRYEPLTLENLQINGHLADLLQTHAPDLLAIFGVGTEVAGQLLITAGDNPERIRTEAALAALNGTAPLPARPERPPGTASAVAGTALLTRPSTGSSASACGTTTPPVPTSSNAPRKAPQQTGNHPVPQTLRSPRNPSNTHRPHFIGPDGHAG